MIKLVPPKDTEALNSDEDNVIQNFGPVLAGWLTGSDAGNKAALLFQIICNFKRIKAKWGLEICKKYNK